MVKFGEKNPQVADVQKTLSLLGYDLITDCVFEKRTLRSLSAFQKKHKIDERGFIGNKTLSALQIAKEEIAVESVVVPQIINYQNLDIITDYELPSNQYVKQITEKSQIFLHFTAGGPVAKNTIHHWNSNEPRIATSYVIDGDTAKVYQAFHPDYFAWHLGVKGTNGKLDRASIGIELCAFGPLVKKNNKYYAWPNNYTTVVDSKNVYTLESPFRGHIYYYAFSDAQILTLEKLLFFLINKYKIKIQTIFNVEWLEFNQELINKCLPGVWSHSNVRKDKSDIYPDGRIIQMLNKLSKKFH